MTKKAFESNKNGHLKSVFLPERQKIRNETFTKSKKGNRTSEILPHGRIHKNINDKI